MTLNLKRPFKFLRPGRLVEGDLELVLTRRHGLKAVWLTTDPKNIASQRACELAGAKYVGTIRLPKTHGMYAEGERYKRRYWVDL